MQQKYPILSGTIFLLWAALLPLAESSAFAALAVDTLRCEYRESPLGIDNPQPRFGWVLHSRERAQFQTAYRVLVASSPAILKRDVGDLWDSGKVLSSESIHVVYAGKALRSGQRAYWKIKAWDAGGKGSSFSAPAWFEMGLLNPADWQAKWIKDSRPAPANEAELFQDRPAPLFRKEFTIAKKLVRARAYVSGLGYYELRLNGQRAGNHVLDPGWTTYSKRVLYSCYDVTEMMQKGENTVGVMLGNGWFNPLPLRFWGHINIRPHLTTGEPRFILQLVMEFSDGSTQTVVSDESWKTTTGPVLRNNLYLGEVYDARKEKSGWDQKGFDDSLWPAVAVAQETLGPLRVQAAPPIRVTRVLKPVKLTEPKPGVFIFDLEQNFAGWARLRVRGAAGTRVTMRYGELLYPDGMLNGMTSVAGQIKGGGPQYRYNGEGIPKTAFQQDQFVLRGDGQEVYTPRFTFHGFRYVEVTGYPGKPTLNSLEGLRLNSDVGAAGSFECSNGMFNRIQQMVLWTELSNLFSVQSDCPHREKFGYGGDIVAASEMALFNFDMGPFYGKAVHDLADAVRPNGGFTETSPYVGIGDTGLGGGSGPIGWGTAHPLLLSQLYQYYGDRRLLEEQYENLKQWIDFIHSKAVDGILDNGLSDHESLVPKPRALTGTAFYYWNVRLFEQIAKVLKQDADAAQAGALAEEIKAAFNRRFLDKKTGRYERGTQACQAFALYLGLVPPEVQAKTLELLVKDIQDAHDGHLTTGIFGTKFMLNALTEQGRGDVAFQVVNQRTFPGWGHMLENGATTLWEHWEFSDNTYSHNHPMFGSVSEWFYKALAGISAAPDAAGFSKIVIAPEPVGDLEWVKASYRSVRGRIVSEWKQHGRTFNLHVEVPVGVTATVRVPATNRDSLREGGKTLESARGCEWLGWENGKAVLRVGSGDYRFSSITD